MADTIPTFPERFRADTKDFIRTCGGKTFVREVVQEFRKRFSDDWWEWFWRALTDAGKEKLMVVARRLGVTISSVSRKHLSVTVLMGYLIDSEQTWGDLKPVPRKAAVSARCYTEAICHAQSTYERVIHARGLLATRPTRDEFELLLWLYKEEEWFDRLIMELKMQKKERAVSQQARNEIAARVIEQAKRHLSQKEQSKNDGSLLISSQFTGSESRIALEKLQATWGPGWMIAIHCIPYKWEV